MTKRRRFTADVSFRSAPCVLDLPRSADDLKAIALPQCQPLPAFPIARRGFILRACTWRGGRVA